MLTLSNSNCRLKSKNSKAKQKQKTLTAGHINIYWADQLNHSPNAINPDVPDGILLKLLQQETTYMLGQIVHILFIRC